MATNLPVFTEKDRNRYKNKKACDVAIPFIYETVIAWGCKKEEHESFMDYYYRRPEKLWNDMKKKWEKEVEEKLETYTKNWPEENKRKEKDRRLKILRDQILKKLLIKETWTKVERNHLSQANCDGFDSTLLHRLVPAICDGIGRYDPNTPSSTEIEKFLQEVKYIRLDLCHDPKSASVSDSILDKLEVSAVNVFKAAGVLYASSLDEQTVQDKIDELTKMLQSIKEVVMTDEPQRIIQIVKKLTEEGRAEMEKVVRHQATDYLPNSDGNFTRTDIYHDVSVSMSVENKNEDDAESLEGKKTVEFRSTQILQMNSEDFLLCEGEPGSGKTTLLRRLQEDYCARGRKMFAGLDMYDLLLCMDCRDNTLKDVFQLLERTFPEVMNQLRKEEVFRALHELKLLICVDGLDELNRNSKRLLDELINTFLLHGNATFVCTSRPGQSDSLRSVQYQTMTLQPITREEEQISFLERYQANIRGIAAPELIRAFTSLVQSCKDCLRQPVYLALFCYLFRKYGQRVCLWTNELSFMEHILTLSEQTMIDRMKTTNLENLEDYAGDATKAITQLSVQLVCKGQVTIDRNTYTELRRRIFGQAEVPHYSILSSYFTRHADGESFDFYHKSYLEFLAAKQLYKSLASTESASIIAAIKSHEENLTNLSDAAARAPDVTPAPDVTDGEDVSVRQFVNVVRFLTLMLVEGGPALKGALKRFLEEVYPAFARERIGFHYWVEITTSCQKSDMVVEAAAKAAKTVSDENTSPDQRKWQITTRRDMRAVSLMLPYHQPAWLDIRPLRSEGLPVELKPLLKGVAKWHTGQLDLLLEESFISLSGIDDLVICLESARCPLVRFMGCMSGSSESAWRALVGGVKRAELAGMELELSISLLNPRLHELGVLEGTRHKLDILARLPSSPGDRRPLPTSSLRPPWLIVQNNAFGDEETTAGLAAALIEDLAPNDNRYYGVYIEHYPGTAGTDSDAVDNMMVRLDDNGVRTDDHIPDWKDAWKDSNGKCCTCRKSIHRPGERCLRLWLS